MIQIINPSGQILELLPGTSIPVERNLPLLSDSDQLLQDVSYPGKAPLSENNKIFIQNGHLVEAANGVYELPAKVFVAGEAFYAGKFSYKIADDQIQFTLKVNLGAVAAYMKTVKLSEIYTVDAGTFPPLKADQEAYMKETVLNPLNYPAIHFPVYNAGWHPDTAGSWDNLMNSWDIETEQFNAGDFLGLNAVVPFFRITHVVKEVFKILGFQCEGGFFDSDYYNRLCLYTRRWGLGNLLYPTNYFLSDILIGDFLKQVRKRLNLNYDIDLMAGKVYIDAAADILQASPVLDLSPYVTRITEIETPEKKGYSITLKVNKEDSTMNLGLPEVPNYNPEFTLTVGGGENAVELDIGVLRDSVQENGYTLPITNERIYKYTDMEITSWQLRLIEFKGMVPVTGGGTWPEAVSAQLRPEDGAWYRFLNDTKEVKIQLAVPPVVLSKIRPHHKFLFRSAQGNLSCAISRKISYSHTNSDAELIPVEISAMTMVTAYDTQVTIQRTPDIFAQKGTMTYKAYWDSENDYVKEFKLVRVALSGPAEFESTTIKNPSDAKGVGGDIGFMYQTNGNDAEYYQCEFRVYDLTPRYLVFGGRKYNFLTGSGYLYAAPDGYSAFDASPVWVVF